MECCAKMPSFCNAGAGLHMHLAELLLGVLCISRAWTSPTCPDPVGLLDGVREAAGGGAAEGLARQPSAAAGGRRSPERRPIAAPMRPRPGDGECVGNRVGPLGVVSSAAGAQAVAAGYALAADPGQAGGDGGAGSGGALAPMAFIMLPSERRRLVHALRVGAKTAGAFAAAFPSTCWTSGAAGSPGFAGSQGLAAARASPARSMPRSKATSSASRASLPRRSCRSSLNSRRVSQRQCRKRPRNGERRASIKSFSCTSTGTILSQTTFLSSSEKAPCAASELAAEGVTAGSPPSPSPSSSSWLASLGEKHTRISSQVRSAKASISACPPGSSSVPGSSRRCWSSASANAARKLVTSWEQTLNFCARVIWSSMKR
mmetsp:Transcript_83070/g.235341  ORF Transcript_83070/g.235341 Transcript_83070/m.235341 type:complete len:374 (+) Transcript_83070:141-1262(+)